MGRAESNWDRFASHRGKVKGGATADGGVRPVSPLQGRHCDSEAAQSEELSVLDVVVAGMPSGTGPVNQRGIDHYSRLVDALMEAGDSSVLHGSITGICRALEIAEDGPNRESGVRTMRTSRDSGKASGDRITTWAPFNMPWTFTYYGYGVGVFPPCKADFNQFSKGRAYSESGAGRAFRAIKAASSKANGGERLWGWHRHIRRPTARRIGRQQRGITL